MASIKESVNLVIKYLTLKNTKYGKFFPLKILCKQIRRQVGAVTRNIFFLCSFYKNQNVFNVKIVSNKKLHVKRKKFSVITKIKKIYIQDSHV